MSSELSKSAPLFHPHNIYWVHHVWKCSEGGGVTCVGQRMYRSQQVTRRQLPGACGDNKLRDRYAEKDEKNRKKILVRNMENYD